jgi:F-type H+-transporting ATPase subunit delta
MSNPTHDEARVAEVYASALLTLAQERGEEARIADELSQLASLVKTDARIADFFSSEAVDASRRHELVESLLRGKASDTLVDTLQVMYRKGRAGLIRAVERAYHAMLEKLRGRIEVVVSSATKLTAAQEARLRQAIKSKTGKEPELIAEIDPDLIGGLVVKVGGDKKLDASVREKLRQMTKAFRERGSRELQRIDEYVLE